MKCVIIDDELPAREELKYFINNFSNIKITGEFDNATEALKYIENHQIDVVFLDINMPKLDGMTFGKLLKKINKNVIIIFITAYRQYAVEAFELEAFDYLLKPYSEERIINTLNKLSKIEIKESCSLKNNLNKITLWKAGKMKVISISDICFCEAMERETYVYTETDEYVCNISISEMYKKLEEENFFKSHRSYIVNLNKIIEIIPWFNSTYMIKVRGRKEDIPVSRNNTIKFKQIMGI